MFAVMSTTEVMVAILVPSTLTYLGLLFLTVIKSRSLERMLIVLGLLTGVYAVWCNFAAAESSMQVQAGQATVTVGSDIAGVVARLAVLLVLSGLGLAILGLGTARTPQPSKEEGIHVNRQ
jgi:hypothetical protein